eukprot:scaffold5151_cov125-Isochrysis_galbana.AAC.3
MLTPLPAFDPGSPWPRSRAGVPAAKGQVISLCMYLRTQLSIAPPESALTGERCPLRGSRAVELLPPPITPTEQAQIDPRGTKYTEKFLAIDDAFNIVFLFELIVNIYCHWLRKFWTAWNVFDLLVVTVGILSVARVNLPGPFGLLRMLRAFRVFRLFKRIKSLRKIMVSLVRAIPGILNSALIMVLVMCEDRCEESAALAPGGIGGTGGKPLLLTPKHGVEVGVWQQLGSEVLARLLGYPRARGEGNEVSTRPPPTLLLNFPHPRHSFLVGATTTRDLTYGHEYFGTFSASLLTTFQILTGDSWSEIIARPIIAGTVAEKVNAAGMNSVCETVGRGSDVGARCYRRRTAAGCHTRSWRVALLVQGAVCSPSPVAAWERK